MYKKKLFPLLLALALMMAQTLPALSQEGFVPYHMFEEGQFISKLALFHQRLYGLGSDHQGRSQLYELALPTKAFKPLLNKSQGPGDPEAAFRGISYLFADSQGLLGFHPDSLTLYRINISQDSFSLSEMLTLDDWASSYVRQLLYQDPYLYAAIDDQIIRVDTATKESVSLTTSEVRALAAYHDGTVIGAVLTGGRGNFSTEIQQFDFNTRQAHSLGAVDWPEYYGHNLLYAPEDDIIYLGSSSQLVAWQPGQPGVTPVTQFPKGDVLDMLLLPQNQVAICVSDLVAIRSLDPEKQAKASLTLLDPIGRGHEYKGFLQDAQGVDLVFYPLNEEEANGRFINDMLTRDARIDVYVLSDSNLLSQIKQKGFALPLGANEELKNKAEQMEAPFLEAFQKDQDLLVFPKEMYVNLPVVDTALLQQMGLPLPTTYLDYFKLCESFLSEHQKNHPDVLVLPFDQGMGLVEVLAHAAQDMQRNGQPLRFDTEEVRELVAQMHKVAMLQNDLPQQVNSWLFYSYYLPTLPEGREYLLMRLEEGMQPSLMIGHEDLRYFVINPYTKNPEAARKLVASYAASLPAPLDILLDRTQTQPVQQPDYPQRRNSLLEQLALMEEALQKAEGAEKAELKKQQDALQLRLLSLEKDERWWFDELAMQRVRELSPRVYLPGFNPILLLAREYPDFFLEYQTNPAFDPARFVSQLDSMVNTAMLEHQ